jgi:hypothetical protein
LKELGPKTLNRIVAQSSHTKKMHKRVERELEQIERDPRAVSQKSEKQIQRMGVSPDRDVVDKMLAAKITAYRKQMGMKEGDQRPCFKTRR